MTTGTYLTPAGLQIPGLVEIQNAIAQDLRADVDPLLNTDPDSPVGQLIGPFASALREAFEVVQILGGSLDPDQAEGAQLEKVSAITGTVKRGPTYSTFIGSRSLDLTLGANATIPAGTVFEVNGDPTTRFQTTVQIKSTLAGNYKAPARCLALGPIPCNANTLTVIITPVIGLNGVNNAFDAVLGYAGDNDLALRTRREAELRAIGNATPDAIRSDVLDIVVEGDKPILECSVFYNDTDFFDVNGLPPHSIEALVYDGIGAPVPNDVIAQAIFGSKAGGVQAVGSSFGNATDSQGKLHQVKFTRPTIKDIAFQITVQQDPQTYAGDAAAKVAILAKFKEKAVKSGATIRCNDYVAALLALSGVTDVPNVQITFNGSGFPSAGVNLVLGSRQIGNCQASWIALTDV